MGLTSSDINILFQLKNGSLDYYNQTSSGASHVVIVFLLMLFIAGLTLNVLLVITVISNDPLRRCSYNILLAHMCVASAVECLLNIGGSVAVLLMMDFLARKHNTEAIWLCRTTAAFSQWTLCVINWLLAALAMERAASLRITITSAGTKSVLHETQESTFAKNARRFIPPLAWFLSAILALPILVTRKLPVAIFPYRYGCSAYKMGFPSTIAYPFSLVVLGVMVPWLVVLFALSVIVRYLTAEQQRRRRLEIVAQQRQVTGPTAALAAVRHPLPSNIDDTCCCCFSTKLFAWNESSMYFLLSVIIVAYFIMIVPSAIMFIYEMFIQNDSQEEMYHDYYNLIGSLPPELRPVLTSVIESIFTWTRFLYTIILPLTIFIIHKEIRKKFEYLFCCWCSRNLIEDVSLQEKVASASVKQLSAIRRKLSGKAGKYNRIAGYRTPVLFATAEGLHLRLVDEDWGLYQQNNENLNTQPRIGSAEPRFRCEFCDVGIQMNAPYTEMPMTMSFRHRGNNKVHLKSMNDLDIRDAITPMPQNEQNAQHPTTIPLVKKTVRFANTVAEIPLIESGGWSGMEDVSPIPPKTNEQYPLQQMKNNRKLSPNSLNNIKNKKNHNSDLAYKDNFIM